MTDPALVLQQLPLQFTYNHRPTIPITFRSGKKSVNCTGLVDSGASYTLFHASLAQQLGIDLTNAPTLPFIGVGHGTITGYEAPVEIGIGGVFYPASVYFSHDLNPNVEGMLGQVGFFDNFVVEFDRSGKSLLVKDRNALVTAQLLQATNASVLGKEIASGQLVTIEQEERLKGFYVIGNTGSGKTTLLVNLILQDIEQGMGVCFFDTHGDAITDILKRLPVHREKDVILLDLLDSDYAFGLNLFQCSDPKNKQEVSRISSYVMQVFAKLFTESGDLLKEAPNMAETLQNAIPVLLAHQTPHMTMAEIPLLLMDETARLKLLAPLNNLYVRNFWNSYNRWKADRQEELTSSTRRRVGNFINDPLILEIVGQSETTVDFRKIMDERKILLVKLSRRHELISSLVGSVIVGQIANAAFSREDTPEDQRIQFNLFADEYQRFSTPVFAELLAEVRKYKIATCVAHQWRGQLDHANRGATLNAANRVVYQVSGEDAEELAKQFDATPPPAREEDIEIIDGTEPILTPVKDVVGHLLTKGGHPNDVVNQFVNDLLHQFKRQDDVDHTHLVDNLNLLFYQAMKGNNTTKFMFNPALVHVFGIASNPGFSEYTLVFNPYQGRDSDLYIFENPNVYAPARQALQLLWSASPGSWQEQQAMQTIDASAKTYLRDTHLKQLYAAMNMAKNGQNIQQSWYYIDANLVEWETVDNPSYSRYAPTSIQLPKVGQEWKFYREADLMQFIEAEIQPWRDTFLRFIRELKEVCQALADDPIRERSGLEQPRKRIQHIVHAQQTHADKQAEIASSLANPPIPYTARAKLGTKEYTIQALPFRQPDASDVVATRRDRIVANTRKQYCKKREEVVKEIEARQNELMKSAPPKPGTKREE